MENEMEPATAVTTATEATEMEAAPEIATAMEPAPAAEMMAADAALAMNMQPAKPELIIRPAQKEDYPAINQLLLQLAKMHADRRPDIFRPKVKTSERDYRKLLKQAEKNPILVAVQEGRVVGHMFTEVIRQKKKHHKQARRVFYIDDLCIDETCRRQGIGQRFLQEAALLARINRCDAIELNVFHCNEGAIQFYESQGFSVQRVAMEKGMPS